MSGALAILEALPSATDFYDLYWNRRPFIVRGAIPEEVMAGLISADELAGLALEEGPQSRMIKTAGVARDWSCRFGPFSKEDFQAAGDANWSLLVQNVEQFHPKTAELLRYFDFAPRWLMDDVMVGYSTPGGSVGPHIDSYHVFLVQGQGRRRWTVGREAIVDEVYLQGLDLKVLAGDLDGEVIEVGCGDVLYLPPKFGHEGTTTEESLTFSVGFLGPKLSELFGAYGQYLSELEDRDQRYVGDGLSPDSAGFQIGEAAAGDLGERFAAHLRSPEFSEWLVAFFSESGHPDVDTYGEREDMMSPQAFAEKLRHGAVLIKPEYVKLALTASPSGAFCLGFHGQSTNLDDGLVALVRILMKEQPVDLAATPELVDDPATLEFLLGLYKYQVVEFR